MCRSPVASPTVGAMEKKELRFSDAQAPSLLVFEVPALIAAGGEPLFTLALPLLKRQGGFLVAFPCGVIGPEAFPSTPADEDQMLGLARTFEGLALYEEEETEAGGLQLIPTGTSCSVVVCDVLDSILVYLREFDPVTDSQVELVPFDEARPAAVPMHAEITPLALEWARSEVEGRVLFYSAREEQEPPVAPAPRTAKKATAKRVTTASLAEQVSALSAQMSLLLKQQAVTANGPAAINPGQQSPIASPAAGRGGIGGGYRVPPVSQMLSPPPKTANGAPLAILGPPPKVRQVPPQVPLPAEEPYDILDEGALPDTTAAVLSQQSAALTALVTHLVGQDNPLDLSGTIGTASSSTKGTMRREKMQQELAGRKSNFFLQIQQQIHKKMYPSRMLPKTEEELSQAQVSLMAYLERYGGYKGQKEAGLCMWIFAHAMDSASAGDFVATKEFLALGVMALEQSVFDAGDWSLAYVLTMAEDPPATMFSERMSSLTAAGRPFSPLVPPTLASTNLAYIKELEVLSTRRAETRTKKGGAGSPSQAGKNKDAEEENPSPKRRPRYPKKPKAIAGG